MINNRWLLPEGIDEVLPPAAWRLEYLRRDLLDLYRCWGYDLVLPPFIEFIDSLLTGTGNDLDLETFKLIDQLSGRMLGIRADMTPQVARIDAHRLTRQGPVRLCYMGTVLRTRSDGFGSSRSPLQVGAELYGHQGIESDLEVIALLLATLQMASVSDVHLDLGHVGIFRALVQQAQLSPQQEAILFEQLQRKALPELHEQLEQLALPSPITEMFLALPALNGGSEALAQAEQRLAAAGDEVHTALAAINQLSMQLQQQHPQLPIHFDFAELRGYHYHTGVVFAAYVPQFGQEIARGGRYDKIGEVFGRARPATGFSADLKTLLALGESSSDPIAGAIYAPNENDPELLALINELRRNKQRVISALSEDSLEENELRELQCERQIKKLNGVWQVVPIAAC